MQTSDLKLVSGFTVYARFRSDIESMKFGPRGGMLALIKGEWKRVRPSRAKRA